jgi:ABC-type branched-subunit amino acid transport system ATPase component
MGDPDIIFLDEPSVGMDFDSLKKAKRLLQNKNLEKELTIVVIEHNMSFINEMSNKILRFNEDSYDLILNKSSKKVLYV